MRAIAVVAVVLFHYRVNFVPGGFAGVDIFFVISGYLMTSIITRRLEEGRFSLLGFYGDRARRIIPPLCGLIVTLVGLGYFLIDPTNYHRLSASAVSAVFFFSNIEFWREAGYFGAQNNMKWFLHTWSLSVEWQFYLLYPLLLMPLHRFVRSSKLRSAYIGVLALFSLGFCVAVTVTDQNSAFYLLPFRVWELLAGGLVALSWDKARRVSGKASPILHGSGLALIALALFGFDQGTPWPSLWTLVPVLGTCSVIAARQTESPVLTNRLSVLTGDWSYAIYLWHWPIAVTAVYLGFVRVHTPRLTILSELLILIGLMVTGGTLVTVVRSRLKPARIAPDSGKRLVSAWQICGIGAFILAQSVRIHTPVGLVFPDSCDGLDPLGDLRPCTTGHGVQNRVLFIGDSQIMQIYARFTEALAEKHDASFTFLVMHGCPPVPGVERTGSAPHCGTFVEKALKTAEQGDYERIVFASRWDALKPFDGLEGKFASFTEHLHKLRSRGKTVVVLSETPVPEFDVTEELLRRRFFGQNVDEIEHASRQDFEQSLASIKPRLREAAMKAGAVFIDPLDFLCTGNSCAMVNEKGESLFFDQAHFRTEAVMSARFNFLDAVAGLNERAAMQPQ